MIQVMGYAIYENQVKDILIEYNLRILTAALTLLLSMIIVRAVNISLKKTFEKTNFDETLERFARKTTVGFLKLLSIAIALVILGVDLSNVIATFGIMGFIVGFALKDTLGNFAAGVMILVNKPFKVGDEIEVKEARGIVRTVSMSHTQLVNGNESVIEVPNSFIITNPVKNHSARKKSNKK